MNKFTKIAIGAGCVCAGWILERIYELKIKPRRHRKTKKAEQPSETINIPDIPKADDNLNQEPNVNTMNELEDIPDYTKYTDLCNSYKDEKPAEKTEEAETDPAPAKRHKPPYEIDEDEFEESDYEKHDYTLYADGVIVDENDKEVLDWRDRFGVAPIQKLEAFGNLVAYVKDDYRKEVSSISVTSVEWGGQDDED